MQRRYPILALTLCFGSAMSVAAEQAKAIFPKRKQFELERSISDEAKECMSCHQKEGPGQFNDWAESAHARSNVTCIDCHGAQRGDLDIAQEHFEYGPIAIATAVTPKDCSRCHPDEVKEHSQSKHANTLKIIWKIDDWLRQGMNSQIERTTGCFHCHGSVLKLTPKGKLSPDTWPNVGVGRVNLDGSLGSCSSCHTRHRFSIAEARKPEACGQCHLGPDHPQIEIYNESKHGAIYAAEGHTWRWRSAAGAWTHGVDFRTPTCATCHMSGAATAKSKAPTTHNVTERLAWELQAALTVRPSDFKPLPAKSHWTTERAKMKTVCVQCHAKNWYESHFDRLDQTVQAYNDVYYSPAKSILDALAAKKLISTRRNFDDPIEVEFYELWHHEGRRARMGVAMMAPDYAWWHGFYELKKRLNRVRAMAQELERTGKPQTVRQYPGATGNTTAPAGP